jgi:hypothetical protein
VSLLTRFSRFGRELIRLSSHSKNRGKRPAAGADGEGAMKKQKEDKEPLSEYQKEVKRLASSLRDEGTGVRPVMK